MQSMLHIVYKIVITHSSSMLTVVVVNCLRVWITHTVVVYAIVYIVVIIYTKIYKKLKIQ